MTRLGPSSPDFNRQEIMRFALTLGLLAAFFAVIPTLVGLMATPPGGLYLGVQTNTDDHMVYAAWMRQAMDGRLLFENRFAVDPQPGLTVHVYFLILGWVAQLTGIVGAVTLARVAFSFLFVWLLGRLLVKLGFPIFTAKFALMFACFGGGIGFLTWQMFGNEIADKSGWQAGLMAGRLPIDVWQPEAFVFPSMLTNSLFMASLCLMVLVLTAVMDARDSWRPVLGGAVAFGVLMNVHSYDVLLLTLVLVGFLVASLASGTFTGAWAGRAAVIGLGAVPAAAWFVHVLREDAVFQARAATLTFSPTFGQVLFGILPAAVLAIAGLWKSPPLDRRRYTGAGLIAAMVVALFVLAYGHDPGGYFTGWAGWAVMFGAALLALALIARPDPGWNLIWAWALVGVVALYFPMLFQRKLAMGLIVPWAVLAAVSLSAFIEHRERSSRNLIAAIALLVSSASSVFWVQRELLFIRTDVASTTVHSVFYSNDVRRIIGKLNQLPGRRVLIALPGVPTPGPRPATFLAPYIPDLNPILTGMTGAFSYAGHWSETPDYLDRRNRVTRIFLATTTSRERGALLAETGAEYIVAPVPATYARIPLADLRPYGEVLYEGNQLMLVRVRR